MWDDKAARKDFNMVANLDPTLAPLVHRELKNLSGIMREKYWEEKDKYWNILEKEKKEDEEEEKEDEERMKEKEEKKESEAEEEKTHKAESETAATKVGEEERGEFELLCKDESASKDGNDNTQEQSVKAIAKDETANKKTASSAEAQPETNQRAPLVTEGKDWQQMLRLTMFLQDEGNFLIKEHHYGEAAGKYKEALAYVDFLQNKVRFHTGMYCTLRSRFALWYVH